MRAIKRAPQPRPAVLFGRASTNPAEIERAVEALLRGIARDCQSLVEYSRCMAVEHQHA